MQSFTDLVIDEARILFQKATSRKSEGTAKKILYNSTVGNKRESSIHLKFKAEDASKPFRP